MAATFEREIEQAIRDEIIPGCVLHATNRDGSFTYAKALGTLSMRQPRPPLQLSTTMWIASCTKLMTSICAMQLVERGQLRLDDPVYPHIPELQSRPVLTALNDDGTVAQEPHKTPITLRHLLTHTSGMAYDGMHPLLVAWAKHHATGDEEASKPGTILERFNKPLVFEPGTSWMYGPSLDYVGVLIERVSGKSLEDFMRENLWEPLGIRDMSFHLHRRPDLKARMAEMARRDEETGKVVAIEEDERVKQLPYLLEDGSEVRDCMGGQGVFASAEEYIKVLRALLSADQDGDRRVFRNKETVEEFFTPNLGQGAREMLNAVLQNDVMNNAMGGVPREVVKDWGLGGLLAMGDLPDGKREGTMVWGGLPNLIWFCDRKAGLTGLYAGQVLPTGDAQIANLMRKFEAGVYKMYKSRSG
ncbi:beta-lactamase/transpeptidase-like protein [Westerdykella ornata]|uniref:Beta-lactamase/transpeptidase-like protein n=1 Tax=Westerdykella ornata TaxID=318751 RepID=A0A6A6JAZ9_WESOR|nr:beta-lactamase/transpeptidase-like protein [Westerdykella ornata]KAF2273781.1 beta-lactamase/transpeptidase-like protein [Westerdykella ornata]